MSAQLNMTTYKRSTKIDLKVGTKRLQVILVFYTIHSNFAIRGITYADFYAPFLRRSEAEVVHGIPFFIIVQTAK